MGVIKKKKKTAAHEYASGIHHREEGTRITETARERKTERERERERERKRERERERESEREGEREKEGHTSSAREGAGGEERR